MNLQNTKQWIIALKFILIYEGKEWLSHRNLQQIDMLTNLDINTHQQRITTFCTCALCNASTITIIKYSNTIPNSRQVWYILVHLNYTNSTSSLIYRELQEILHLVYQAQLRSQSAIISSLGIQLIVAFFWSNNCFKKKQRILMCFVRGEFESPLIINCIVL